MTAVDHVDTVAAPEKGAGESNVSLREDTTLARYYRSYDGEDPTKKRQSPPVEVSLLVGDVPLPLQAPEKTAGESNVSLSGSQH